jgi:hypothetical protein
MLQCCLAAAIRVRLRLVVRTGRFFTLVYYHVPMQGFYAQSGQVFYASGAVFTIGNAGEFREIAWQYVYICDVMYDKNHSRKRPADQ